MYMGRQHYQLRVYHVDSIRVKKMFMISSQKLFSFFSCLLYLLTRHWICIKCQTVLGFLSLIGNSVEIFGVYILPYSWRKSLLVCETVVYIPWHFYGNPKAGYTHLVFSLTFIPRSCRMCIYLHLWRSAAKLLRWRRQPTGLMEVNGYGRIIAVVSLSVSPREIVYFCDQPKHSHMKYSLYTQQR